MKISTGESNFGSNYLISNHTSFLENGPSYKKVLHNEIWRQVISDSK
jgi:hypothetical protein